MRFGMPESVVLLGIVSFLVAAVFRLGDRWLGVQPEEPTFNRAFFKGLTVVIGLFVVLLLLTDLL